MRKIFTHGAGVVIFVVLIFSGINAGISDMKLRQDTASFRKEVADKKERYLHEADYQSQRLASPYYDLLLNRYTPNERMPILTRAQVIEFAVSLKIAQPSMAREILNTKTPRPIIMEMFQEVQNLERLATLDTIKNKSDLEKARTLFFESQFRFERVYKKALTYDNVLPTELKQYVPF
jgi:hypothetical protein